MSTRNETRRRAVPSLSLLNAPSNRLYRHRIIAETQFRVSYIPDAKKPLNLTLIAGNFEINIVCRLLNNCLQLTSVTYRILDDGAARRQDILFGPCSRLRLDWEVYPSVTKNPAALLRELDDGTLRFEEEKVLRVGDGKRRICLFGAVGNLAADRTDKDLDRAKKKDPSVSFKMLSPRRRDRRCSHSRTNQSPLQELSRTSSPATPCRSFPPSSSSPAPLGI